MKTIRVTASNSYDVLVGNGLLKSLGVLVNRYTKASRCVIVSDCNVFPIYGSTVTKHLADAGLTVCDPFVFPAGEQSKCADTYISLLNHLARCHITRADCVIALGGGVVGDLTGFAAATFLRGIDFIQVPTTLLAAVDSSIGGKTAIDLDAGKNLAGAFYQPKLVICDVDTLDSLADDIFRDGCAEIIKYGVLYDKVLFEHLLEKGLDFDREAVIGRCVELKRDVVAQDEFDRGERMKLNLGHTIGHGVEARSKFTVSHGSAVAIGLSIITRSAVKTGICDPSDGIDIMNVIEKFGLSSHTEYTADELYTYTLSDKKRSGGSVNLIIPERIGSCRIAPTPVEQVKSIIEAGL